MAERFISPLPAFTLESLVAFRQWSAQQRSDKKKFNSTKTNPKSGRNQTGESKAVKNSE